MVNKLNLRLDNFLSGDRASQISRFKTGVSRGMHSVQFFNAGAARDLSFGQDSFMGASASFGLASATSGEKAGFCENMLSSMKNDLDCAQLGLEMSVTTQVMLVNAMHANEVRNGQKNGNMISNNLKSNIEEKQFMAEMQKQQSLNEAYSQLSEALGTLEEFNSNADMQFKNLKNAADNQELMARKQYYNFVNSSASTGSSISGLDMDKKEDSEEDKKANGKQNKNFSNITKANTNGMKLFGASLTA